MQEQSDLRIVDNKGRVVIPSKLRQVLGLKQYDLVEVVMLGDGVLVRPYDEAKALSEDG